MTDWKDEKIQYILGGAWPYNGPKPDKKEMEILRARIRKVLEDVCSALPVISPKGTSDE